MFLWEAVKVAGGATPSEVSPGVTMVLIVIPLAVVIAIDLIFTSPHFDGSVRRAAI
jgi:hypothetical protein